MRLSDQTNAQRDLIKEFITYIQVEKGLARNTLESYGRDLARLDRLGKQAWQACPGIDPTGSSQWIAQLSREGLAPSSVARAVSAARGFFRFLMLDGHIKHHPTEDLDTPQRFLTCRSF